MRKHVHRRPFDYAQRQAQVEWQSQPSWDIDCTMVGLFYTTYAAALGLEPTIVCSADTMAYTAYKAVISGDISVTATLATMGYTTYRAGVDVYRIIDCTADTLTLTGQPATVAATLLHIPAKSARARSTWNKMAARDARNRMKVA